MKRFGPWILSFVVILLSITIGFSGSAFYELVKDTFIPAASAGLPNQMTHEIWTRYVALGTTMFAISFVLVLTVALARKKLFGLRASLRKNNDGNARMGVIMGLSYGEIVSDALGGYDRTANENFEKLVEAGFDKASDTVGEMLKSGLLELNDAGRPKFTSPGAHTWVQNLRALREHVLSHKLRYIVICPSKDTADRANAFKEFLARILDGAGHDSITIEISEHAPDYNDFEAVRDTLEDALAQLKTGAKKNLRLEIQDNDICIDSTSGTAGFSIAVGIVTLNHDLKYSYVTTFESGIDGAEPRGGLPRYYDATVDLATFV